MTAWFGDTRAFTRALPRSIDDAQQRATSLLRRIEERPALLLSPGLNLAVSLPLALLIGVPTAGVGAGVLLGGLVAAGSYLRFRASERAAARRLEAAIGDAWIDADQRVALVTKQYEWAVNDVANLRDALRRAQARAADAEAPARARQRTEVVPLVRRALDTDAPTTLRFETDGVAPSQIRILEDRDVVGISARAIEETGESGTFLVAVSDRVAKAVAGSDERFTLEGLVGEAWRPVVIRREHNPRANWSRDKRGRVWRTDADRVPLLSISLAEGS